MELALSLTLWCRKMIPIKSTHVPLPPSKLSFGFQRTPTHKHQGIDFVAPLGTPVYAAESGEVEEVAYEYRKGFSGYGRVVVIKGKSGRWFIYAHLNDIFVGEGERVLEGQKIASVGNTAFTKDEPEKLMSGAHLHFEVSPRGYPQDSEAQRLDPIAFLAEKKTAKPYWRRTRRGVTLRLSRYLPQV